VRRFFSTNAKGPYKLFENRRENDHDASNMKEAAIDHQRAVLVYLRTQPEVFLPPDGAFLDPTPSVTAVARNRHGWQAERDSSCSEMGVFDTADRVDVLLEVLPGSFPLLLTSAFPAGCSNYSHC
jgi:hypothetical protein